MAQRRHTAQPFLLLLFQVNKRRAFKTEPQRGWMVASPLHVFRPRYFSGGHLVRHHCDCGLFS